jgi:hypothetical protein
MKEYTFKVKGKEVFKTIAENDDEALKNAKEAKALDHIEEIKLGPYDALPAVVIMVEEVEEDEEK